MLGFPVSATSTRIALFLATLALLIASLALGLALARTKFGRVLTAVRDAENRLMFVVMILKVSSCLSGLYRRYFVLWQARCMYRRWALSIPVKCHRPTQLKRQLGGTRGPRNSDRAGIGGRNCQRCQKLVHHGDAGILAIFSWPDIHSGHVILPKGVIGLLRRGKDQ